MLSRIHYENCYFVLPNQARISSFVAYAGCSRDLVMAALLQRTGVMAAPDSIVYTITGRVRVPSYAGLRSLMRASAVMFDPLRFCQPLCHSWPKTKEGKEIRKARRNRHGARVSQPATNHYIHRSIVDAVRTLSHCITPISGFDSLLREM